MPSAPSPPPVASASSVAQTAQQYNQQAQQASAVNQTNPYGSLSYTTGPDGQLTANSSLSQPEQGLLNTLQGTQATAGQQGSNVLSQANYGSGTPDLSTNAGSIVESNLGNYENYLNPFFTEQSTNLDNQLRNQGINPGTDAYTRATNDLGQTQDQAVSGFAASMEPQAYNEAVQSYELPLSTASSLASLGSPVGYGSSNVNTPTQTPVNYSGVVSQQQNAQQTQYQSQVQQNNALLNGIFSGLGAVAGAPSGSLIGSALGGLFGGGSSGINATTTTGWQPTIS